MRNFCLFALVVVTVVFVAGCTFAKYSKLHVRVVDTQTQAGISSAQIHAYYMKPMGDMTYQRKDHARTDREGFVILTLATNESQRMILGWTYGIEPMLTVQANGYYPQQVGVPRDAFARAEPLLIEMTNTNEPNAAPEPQVIGHWP